MSPRFRRLRAPAHQVHTTRATPILLAAADPAWRTAGNIVTSSRVTVYPSCRQANPPRIVAAELRLCSPPHDFLMRVPGSMQGRYILLPLCQGWTRPSYLPIIVRFSIYRGRSNPASTILDSNQPNMKTGTSSITEKRPKLFSDKDLLIVEAHSVKDELRAFDGGGTICYYRSQASCRLGQGVNGHFNGGT